MRRFSKTLPGRVRLDAADGRGIAAEAFSQVDDAIVAERADGLARGGVDLLEVVADAENQAPILAVLAFPVVHAAPGHPFEAFVDPDFLARRRVQRNQRTVAPSAVDHAAGHDRVEAGLAVRVGPGHSSLETLDLLICFSVVNRELSGPPP